MQSGSTVRNGYGMSNQYVIVVIYGSVLKLMVLFSVNPCAIGF